jgi:protein-tyrosine phosphatase
VPPVTRHIEFERLYNFRDLGGYPSGDGRTLRWRRLYRSDALSKLAGEDLARFRALGVRTVIDLRYPWEIAKRGRVPEAEGLAYHNLSVEQRPVDQPALGAEVEPVRFFADLHAEVAEDGAAELRQVLRLIAADANRPLVFHCAAGKDRNGLVAALVLALVGVGEEDIVADYALSEPATLRMVADGVAGGRDPQSVWPGFGLAPAESMRMFLAWLKDEYGSVEGYARERLGVGQALVEELRTGLLE